MSRFRPSIVLAFVLALPLVACGEPDVDPAQELEPPEMIDPQTLEYAAELEIDFAAMERTRRGVYYRDDAPGQGEVAAQGRTVVVHYTGMFPDGDVFDTSRDGDEPLTIELGAEQVIPGFDEGLRGMEEGGQRTMIIPPHLAYGAQGAGEGLIPPNAVLVFQVELMEVR